jgi:hypothetical protein
LGATKHGDRERCGHRGAAPDEVQRSVKDGSGQPLTGIAGLTFALDEDQEGGALWIET